MQRLSLKTIAMCGLLLAVAFLSAGQDTAQQNGRLAVTVVNPPDGLRMTNAQVFVHRMDADSMTLVATHGRGEFAASLKTGYYDVVVTDATSVPWAKRIEILAGKNIELTAEMVEDTEHLQE